LHTQTYQHILNGSGFGLDDAMQSIQTAHDIRNAEVIGVQGDFHPLLK
jgi:UDP-N-acetyl-2-amino-2-deoxyglucuronate dehydrogenase